MATPAQIAADRRNAYRRALAMPARGERERGRDAQPMGRAARNLDLQKEPVFERLKLLEYFNLGAIGLLGKPSKTRENCPKPSPTSRNRR
jgi:hypothetical protein